MDNSFTRERYRRLGHRGPGLLRKGAAVFLTLSLLLPGPAARAAEFEIMADSFTVVNQVNVSSVAYFQTRTIAPPDPALATQLLTPGGLYFDATYYNVWDRTALNWVKLATGTVESGRVAKAGDFMSGQLTTASTITVQGNAFSVGGSTFVVTNGNVGIGTTGPGATLHVSSAATAATTPLLIVSSGTATGQELLRVQKDGNVGIGATAPAAVLDVNGNAQFGTTRKSTMTATGEIISPSSITASAFFGNGAALTGVIATDSSKVTKTGDTMTGPLTVAGSSITVIGSAAQDFSLAVTTAANRSVYNLLVSTYGSLGVNIGSNNTLLDVIQAHRNVDNAAAIDIFNNSNTANARTALWAFSATSEGGLLVLPAAHTLYGTQFADRLALVAPSDAYASNGQGASGIDLVTADAAGDVRIYTGGIATTNERMRITASGNVGIGTSDNVSYNGTGNAKPLVISSAGASTVVADNDVGVVIRNSNATNGNTSGLHFAAWNAAASGSNQNPIDASIVAVHGTRVANQYQPGQLAFLTSGPGQNAAPSERMRIDSSGNVGVGTPSPNSPLEVRGDSRISTTAGSYCILRVSDTTTCAAGALIGTNGLRALCLICN